MLWSVTSFFFFFVSLNVLILKIYISNKTLKLIFTQHLKVD